MSGALQAAFFCGLMRAATSGWQLPKRAGPRMSRRDCAGTQTDTANGAYPGYSYIVERRNALALIAPYGLGPPRVATSEASKSPDVAPGLRRGRRCTANGACPGYSYIVERRNALALIAPYGLRPPRVATSEASRSPDVAPGLRRVATEARTALIRAKAISWSGAMRWHLLRPTGYVRRGWQLPKRAGPRMSRRDCAGGVDVPRTALIRATAISWSGAMRWHLLRPTCSKPI